MSTHNQSSHFVRNGSLRNNSHRNKTLKQSQSAAKFSAANGSLANHHASSEPTCIAAEDYNDSRVFIPQNVRFKSGDDLEISLTIVEKPFDGDDSYDQSAPTKCSKLVTLLLNVYRGLRLRYVLPVLLLVLYSCFGAWVFMLTELENDLNQRSSQHAQMRIKLNATIRENSATFLSKYRRGLHANITHESRLEHLHATLFWFANQLNDARNDPDYSPWQFWGSLFFAGSIYTTIGYGNAAPRTTGGRSAVMIYALVGVPLVLCILNDLGKFLLIAMKKGMRAQRHLLRYLKRCSCCNQQCCKRCFRNRASSFSSETSDGSSSNSCDSNDDEEIPISVALVVFTFWMCGCAAVFKIIEPSWTYFECFYFFYISFTTIGLGDLVPSDARFTAFVIPLLLVGLSVISMCLNIVQLNITHLFKQMMRNIDGEYKAMQSGQRSSLLNGANVSVKLEDALEANNNTANNSNARRKSEAARGRKSIASPSLGVMQMLRQEKTLTDRILLRLMDSNMKELLIERLTQRQQMVNAYTQTEKVRLTHVAVQAFDEEFERKKNRKYIYNVDD